MQPENKPKHIAIIMDGNGRWAKNKGLPRIAGHAQGANAVRVVIETCIKLGIKALTLFAFSTENWKRPKEEVDTLMRMLGENLNKELPQLKKYNIKLNTIGDIDAFPGDIQKSISDVKMQTSGNNALILTLALNYGGRKEIVRAAKNIALDVKAGKLEPDLITEELFSSYLYTSNLPEVDLLIRTSGEMRLSNFLLWQLSYSEIYITKKLWPDFTKEDLEAAVLEFSNRHRRFGDIA